MKHYIEKLCILFFVCVLSPGQAQNTQTENKDFEILKNLEIFTSAYKELHLNYVDEVNPGELMKTALESMLKTLDPYTVYIPEADIEDYKIMTLGQYGGIGSLIHYRDGYVYISEPYEGFPADKAGLLPGDKIIKINGEDTKGKNSEQVSSMLKGMAGTNLNLWIERKGFAKAKEFNLVRREIKIDNIAYSGMLKDGIAYIRLDGFTQGASEEFKKAFLDLKNKGMKSLVVDLRYNGGGLLGEAVNMVNLFVPKGLAVVSTKGKDVSKNYTYSTMQEPIDLHIPIVFLISRATASASEIFAGAMQDYDRAVVIGHRSFGKGLVQNIVPLEYNAQMKITISKYYIPSGRCVQSIDYFNKNAEAKGKKLPDSLLRAFTTKNGRLVYDGDGIQPDLETKEEEAGDVLFALVKNFLFFDFASEFKSKNPQIDSVDKFVVNEKIYADFLKYIDGKDYSYETTSEKLLAELSKAVKEDGYDEGVASELAALKQKISHSKEDDLAKYKEQAKQILREEIISRYYYQKGRAQAAIFGDLTVNKALEILSDKKEYSSFLLPKTSK